MVRERLQIYYFEISQRLIKIAICKVIPILISKSKTAVKIEWCVYSLIYRNAAPLLHRYSKTISWDNGLRQVSGKF